MRQFDVDGVTLGDSVPARGIGQQPSRAYTVVADPAELGAAGEFEEFETPDGFGGIASRKTRHNIIPTSPDHTPKHVIDNCPYRRS